jgi:AAA domain
MDAAHPTTLYLICGKIAAGKSTLAYQLAARPATLLITMDDWMSVLYPTENRTIEDFGRLSARPRDVMGPHVVDILRQDISVVLDFPANTVKCKARLRQRNTSGEHRYQVNEATYDLFMSYVVLPTADEGFNVIVHTS